MHHRWDTDRGFDICSALCCKLEWKTGAGVSGWNEEQFLWISIGIPVDRELRVSVLPALTIEVSVIAQCKYSPGVSQDSVLCYDGQSPMDSPPLLLWNTVVFSL